MCNCDAMLHAAQAWHARDLSVSTAVWYSFRSVRAADKRRQHTESGLQTVQAGLQLLDQQFPQPYGECIVIACDMRHGTDMMCK